MSEPYQPRRPRLPRRAPSPSPTPSLLQPRLGVFPHTVQVYALDDPTAGAYGNANFSYMEEYLVAEVT